MTREGGSALGTGVEWWCPERVVLLGQHVTGWQCWEWQCLRVVRRCRGVSTHGGSSAGVTGVAVSQEVLGLVGGSRGSLLTRVAVGGVTEVSQWCQCPTGCQGMSGVVRQSPFKGVEMRGSQVFHRGVSTPGCQDGTRCWEGVRECWGAAGGAQRSQGVPVHWGGRGSCHRGVSSRAIGRCLGCVQGVSGVWGISAHQGGSGTRNCPNHHCSSCGGGRAPSRRDRAEHIPPPHSPAPPVPGSGHPQSPQGPQHAGPAGSLINVLIKTPASHPGPPQHTPLHASVSSTIPQRPHENSLHSVTISVISPHTGPTMSP